VLRLEFEVLQVLREVHGSAVEEESARKVTTVFVDDLLAGVGDILRNLR
jgi:hypothetical protein